MAEPILEIQPYRHDGTWVFDDDRVGLVKEPFVSGADTIIDRMVEHIPNAGNGITLLFSSNKFPGCTHEFVRLRSEAGGNWYFSLDYQIEGWLCPALFKYFDRAPNRLFARVRAKE